MVVLQQAGSAPAGAPAHTAVAAACSWIGIPAPPQPRRGRKSAEHVAAAGLSAADAGATSMRGAQTEQLQVQSVWVMGRPIAAAFRSLAEEGGLLPWLHASQQVRSAHGMHWVFANEVANICCSIA